MALVQIENARFGYDGTDIFRDLSFTVSKGEIFCLLGPNGCGKTTLLDCILGTHRLREGSITINGQDISTLRSGRIAHHLAYVPQTHERTFPYTVKEIVLMGRAAYTGVFGSPSRADAELAESALETVGVQHLQNRPYTRLSGGEGQLVMIARALVQETPVIILDEPTAHLDFRNELIILEKIVELVRDTGVSIIMATHFPNHIFYFENKFIATQVALLHEGRFLDVGSPGETLTENTMEMLYGIETRIMSHSSDGIEHKQILPINTMDIKYHA